MCTFLDVYNEQLTIPFMHLAACVVPLQKENQAPVRKSGHFLQLFGFWFLQIKPAGWFSCFS